MTQQTIHAGGPGDDDQPIENVEGGQIFASAQGADDILDEIDSVLEENAEAFVRSFVQKGGQ